MTFDQAEYDVRCEWGEQGLAALAPISEVVIIVDVLSFCTAVDLAVGRGAMVYPFAQRDVTAADYAASIGAVLAGGHRAAIGFTLSPGTLAAIPAGTRLVLPSLNGSTLAGLAAGTGHVLAGCLRNASAVAAVAARLGRRVAVIPAGERWQADGSLRPALEDLLGAGAILRRLPGSKSPEALAAESVFAASADDLPGALRRCSSGKELIARGFEDDVALAAALDTSRVAPLLVDGVFRADR